MEFADQPHKLSYCLKEYCIWHAMGLRRIGGPLLQVFPKIKKLFSPKNYMDGRHLACEGIA